MVPQIKLCGDTALAVEFENEISPQVNRKVRAFTQALKHRLPDGVTEVIPTFRSVLINYLPHLISYGELTGQLREILLLSGELTSTRKRIIEIPVCYGGSFGEDLAYIASHGGLTSEEVVRLHSAQDYLIYMLGFLPGFAYLGGLDPRLFTPRLSTPRLKIPAGSVGIGGEQTGIYPLDSPGGWQLLGRTPLRVYHPSRSKPILYEAGDFIRFIPIDLREFHRIQAQEAAGTYHCQIIDEEE